jgi:hypothetical protein
VDVSNVGKKVCASEISADGLQICGKKRIQREGKGGESRAL